MNAIQFIKENGVEKAREVVEGAPEWAANFNSKIGYTKASNGGEYTVYKNQRTGNEDYSLHHEMGIDLVDLKHIVESVDLIGKYHSIDHAKNHYNNMREALNQYQYENKDIEDLSNELKQAIADYEAIGGEHV